MYSVWCRSHVQEIILQKHMFGWPLKLILGFFTFLAINQNIHTQLCINVKTHHCHMNYFKLDYSSFFHLNLFQVNVICKSSPMKILESFFLFLEPQMWISLGVK
jgi:hypothetical protein